MPAVVDAAKLTTLLTPAATSFLAVDDDCSVNNRFNYRTPRPTDLEKDQFNAVTRVLNYVVVLLQGGRENELTDICEESYQFLQDKTQLSQAQYDATIRGILQKELQLCRVIRLGLANAHTDAAIPKKIACLNIAGPFYQFLFAEEMFAFFLRKGSYQDEGGRHFQQKVLDAYACKCEQVLNFMTDKPNWLFSYLSAEIGQYTDVALKSSQTSQSLPFNLNNLIPLLPNTSKQFLLRFLTKTKMANPHLQVIMQLAKNLAQNYYDERMGGPDYENDSFKMFAASKQERCATAMEVGQFIARLQDRLNTGEALTLVDFHQWSVIYKKTGWQKLNKTVKPFHSLMENLREALEKQQSRQEAHTTQWVLRARRLDPQIAVVNEAGAEIVGKTI